MALPAERQPSVPARSRIEDDPSQSLYQIEAGLRELEGGGGRAVLAVRTAREELAAARQALRLKRARVWVDAKKLKRENGRDATVLEREMFMDENTADEQFEVDICEAAVHYARDLSADREGVRSSLQTRARLCMEAMRLSGFGGREPGR